MALILASCLTADPSKSEVLIVRTKPEEDNCSKTFTGVVTSRSSKLGAFSETFTGSIFGEGLSVSNGPGFGTLRITRSESKMYSGNVSGYSPKFGSFRTKINIIRNSHRHNINHTR